MMGMVLDSGSRTRPAAAQRPACKLHLVQTLPSGVFVDPYELQLRREEYSAVVYGELNLELPVHEMSGEGQVVDVRVAISAEAKEVQVELPLHLRYGVPRKGGGMQVVEISWPEAFWACPPNGASHRMPLLDGTLKMYEQVLQRGALAPTRLCLHIYRILSIRLHSSQSVHLRTIHTHYSSMCLLEIPTTVVWSRAALQSSFLHAVFTLHRSSGVRPPNWHSDGQINTRSASESGYRF
jgi:hypothetical protein